MGVLTRQEFDEGGEKAGRQQEIELPAVEMQAILRKSREVTRRIQRMASE